MLVACGESPPTAEIGLANRAISQAKDEGAMELAADPLNMATTKLSSAQAAVAKDDNKQARYLAEQATVDAQYAEASAMAQRAHQTAQQSKSIESTVINQDVQIK
jgi:hypothetical protein